MQYIWPIIILFVIAFGFSALIVVMDKKFAVKVDKKEEDTKNLLAGANCGACGYAGCSAFAKALVEGKAKVSECSVTSAENKQAIANLLGVENDSEKTKLVVACTGGIYCEDKYAYAGYKDCIDAVFVSNGKKECSYGCMGLGSCANVCPVGAIKVTTKGYAEIDQSKCIACGLCSNTCPKYVIKRIPAKAKYYIACNSHDFGKAVKDICSNGCIGCGMCEKVCPEKAITMDNKLPVINYDLCKSCGKCAEKCPTKCIKSI
ncbi:MAG: RnfABCDGE type electron transport complex subunit B [Clostridia bacterium]